MQSDNPSQVLPSRLKQRNSHRTNDSGSNRAASSNGLTVTRTLTERLLLQHIPLVRAIAVSLARRLPSHVPIDDLVQSGAVALIECSERYDNERHTSFAAYAKHRIRGAMLDSLRRWDWASRTGRSKHKRLENANTRVAQELGRTPTVHEVQDYLKVSDVEFERIRSAAPCESHAATDDSEPLENIPDGRPGSDPYLSYLAMESKSLLRCNLSRLPDRERTIVDHFYFKNSKMKEIARLLGVGESRASQLHSRAIEILRLSFLKAPDNDQGQISA